MAKYQSTLTGPQMDAALAAMPDAEAYARGTRNGQEVQEGDPTYHNNSKYYAQLAQSAFPETYATGAVRGDIDQSTQTEEWRQQARQNMGITDPVWGAITGNISSQGDLMGITGGLGNAIAMKGWNQIIPAYLLPATQTINGVTFTNNGDGTITVNGTASADTSLILVSEARVHVKDKGKFIYSGCPHGGSRDTYCMGFSDSVGFADIGNGHYNENYAYNYNLSIIVKSGTQCNNLVFKPNLFLLEPIFGAGNEPLSVKDFRAMFPADYYPYCSGAWADLLWENASPTSAFASQTISIDLSPYKFVAFRVRTVTSQSNSVLCLAVNDSDGSVLAIAANNAGSACTRPLTASSSGVWFGNGSSVSGNTLSQDNTRAVPVAIYGIR